MRPRSEQRRRRAARGWLQCAAVALSLAPIVSQGATPRPATAEGRPAAASQVEPSRGGGAPAPAGAFAAGLSFGSSREPIVISANQLDFDYQANRVTYRGSVHATQGELTIDSDTLIVTFDRADDEKQAQLREVIAQGNVVIVQGSRKATGSTAVFSQPKRQIVLIGDPVLRDGPNEVTGDRIVVYVDEGRSVVESSPKKRVSAVLYPGTAGGGLEPPPAANAVPAAPDPEEGAR
jgi:lipopolysaccharide export system protein LptA